MKKLYLALLICIPCLLQAQQQKNKREIDSTYIYRQELDSLWSAKMKEYRSSEEYKTAIENLNRVSRKTTGFSGFTIFLDALHSDYGQFNEMLAQEGFPPLEENVLRFGFGTSHKVNRTIVDFYFMAVGMNSKSEKGDEKITAGLSNLLYADIGYNLLKSSNFSVYPYGGLSLRLSNLRYTKKPTENPDYTGIWDMLVGGEDIKLSSTRIGYQLGVGFDIPIFQDKDKVTKVLLFIKAGMNGPLWKDRYHHGDLPKYNTGIKQGTWNITLGCKFGSMF